MEELFNEILSTYLIPMLATILTAIASYVGLQIKKLYEKKINTETKKAIVSDVVKMVEQVYKDIHGQEKLQNALERASEILNEKGLTVSETELKTLLESAVYGLSQGWLEDTVYELTPAGEELIQEEQSEEKEA